MERNFEQEIQLSLWKRLTGRQDPTAKRKIASLIVVVLITVFLFFATFFAGFYINKAMIKHNANVVFHPFVEDNSYLTIEITNGPKDLTNVTLDVKTCYMSKFVSMPPVDLIPGQTYPFHLTDKETVFALGKVFNSSDFACREDNYSADVQCYIKAYIVDGEVYAPPQECKQYTCGYCSYEMKLTSKEFSKNFSRKFPGPIPITDYEMSITPHRIIDLSNRNVTDFSSIGF